MGNRLLLQFAALVTLELSLLDKFLSLGAKASIVTIGKFPLIRVLNRPPLESDVDATGDAYFLSCLVGARGFAVRTLRNYVRRCRSG